MSTVLVLSHGTGDHLGGAERSLLSVLEEWRRREPELDIVVVSPATGAMDDELRRRGLQTAVIDMIGWTVPSLAGGRAAAELRRRRAAQATRELVRVIDELRPAVVVTNTLVYPWAAVAAAARAVPHVWFVREFGEEVQGFFWPEGREAALDDIAALSAVVVANSRAVAAMFEGRADPGALVVSYPPVDLAAVRARARESVPSDASRGPTFRVGVLGRVTRSKGQWRLLSSLHFSTSDSLEVLLVGAVLDTAARAELEHSARHAGPRLRLRFAGEQANPFPWMASCDIAVIPSEKEAFGRSTLECLALGLPVITTSTGAGAELVLDGQCGVIVDPDDLVGMAAAIDRYVREPVLRERHAAAAVQRADEIAGSTASVDEALRALTAARTADPAALPARWNEWMVGLDAVQQPGADRLLRLRSRLVYVAQIASRAVREPRRAVRRIMASIR